MAPDEDFCLDFAALFEGSGANRDVVTHVPTDPAISDTGL